MPRPKKPNKPDRTCASCPTILSVYNDEKHCHYCRSVINDFNLYETNKFKRFQGELKNG